MATRDYRTQAPAALPDWMLNLSTQEQLYGAQSPQFRLPQAGSAEMDQYTAQGGAGAYASGGITDTILNRNQGLNSIDPQGYMVRGSEPTGMDRFGRALSGAFNGYDFGNKAANIGADIGASFVPGGQVVNSAAGAIQGATSDALAFKREVPKPTGVGPTLQSPDVMPRGLYGGGLLDPNASGGGGTRDSLNYNVGGTPQPTGAAGFAQNPIASRPAVPGQTQAAPAGATGFTGGSGAMVDPYTLPAEDQLLTLLANAQRYGGYDASTGRTGLAGAASGTGGYSFSGFDFSQDPGNRDIGKSAKYAFSYFADEAAKKGDPMPRTKAEAEAWFTRNIAPGLQAAGYEIGWVKGDKARIKTREGWDEIDFLGNADGDNPTLTWQSEVLAPGPQMSGGGMGMGGGTLPTSGMDLTSSALFDQLLKQAQAIASGQQVGASVVDTDALIRLLNGGK